MPDFFFDIPPLVMRVGASGRSHLTTRPDYVVSQQGIATSFEVISLKGKVEKGKITEYRTTLEVTFILE